MSCISCLSINFCTEKKMAYPFSYQISMYSIFHTSIPTAQKSLMFFLKWKPKYSITYIYKTYLRLPPLCLKLDIALSALWMDFCTLFNFNEPVPMPPGPRRLNDQFFFSPWYSAIN